MELALRHLPLMAKRALLYLFNRSAARCIVPKSWKVGEIIPLLKAGKPADKEESYRPVTLTSNMCKLMERMVARRLRTQVDPYMCEEQAGFSQNRSTVDPLTHIIGRLLKRKQGEKVGAVFIDYACAFDSVDHGCIIRTLEQYHVDPYLTRWVVNFLSNRTARVKVSNHYSSYRKFTCGVPQGSVLGPILFIITMNTLSVELRKIPGLEHAFFADDLTIMARGTDNAEIQRTLQAALDCISKWTTEHFMELSASKTKYTLFGQIKTDLLKLYVGEKALGEERYPKILGIELQPVKGMQKNIARVVQSARKQLLRLSAVSSSTWGPKAEIMRPFYLALVESILLYAIPAWWKRTPPSQRKQLAQVQRKGASIISGVPSNASTEDLLREAYLQPLEITAAIRSIEYYLKAKTRGGLLAEGAKLQFDDDGTVQSYLNSVRAHYQKIDTYGTRLGPETLEPGRRPYFATTAPGGLSANEATEEAKKQANEERIASKLGTCAYSLWTDGSAVLEEGSCGAAILYDAGQKVVQKASRGAGMLACSYRAQCVASGGGLDVSVGGYHG
ncbi:hypothetical protein STCU_05239 [Strigomonas culicis]|uniref:Reverse transcriptase domain-containing protein n=1 Tax=Strigomonas culicis TaxID=28005 RepID=S9UHL9_9TRYP|nr:hypothetical protein STCU_05239 [Strigomonas culicis]|eukprot:EPY28224.1 hypothetical protein STCU_05239 [Strigomonas culicis]